MLETGIPALRIISLSFIGAGVGIINSTVFQAIGHGLASLVVSFCRQLCIILPVAACSATSLVWVRLGTPSRLLSTSRL